MKGILEEASRQELFRDERTSAAFQSQVQGEACRYLGLPSNAFRKWKSNFLADIYLADSPTGRVLLKVVVLRPREAAAVQFDSLSQLHRISQLSETFEIPQPILLLEGLSSFAMGFLEGRKFTEAIADPKADTGKLRAWARDAGRALAEIHDAWAEVPGPLNFRPILEEFRENSPWRIDAYASSVLDHLDTTLSGVQVPRSRLYLDFDPVNVLVRNYAPIALLDPPEFSAVGPVHWDIGSFMLGIERACWRRPWRIISRQKIVLLLQEDFLQAYRGASSLEFGPVDSLVYAFAQVVRLAQLALWWQRPTRLRRRALAVSRNLYSKTLTSRSWRHHVCKLKELTRS